MNRIAKIILPYIAGVLTRLPWTRRMSLIIDRLIILSEGNHDNNS